MGFSGKAQAEFRGREFDGKRWVVAGIPLRAPLKPVYTKLPVEKGNSEMITDDDQCNCTTPTGEESRINSFKLTCPPAPRKRKATFKCNYSGVREFFAPPDLESVFLRHVERAN